MVLKESSILPVKNLVDENVIGGGTISKKRLNLRGKMLHLPSHACRIPQS
jgi:hypothetical protein